MEQAISDTEVVVRGTTPSRLDPRLHYLCYAMLVLVIVIFAVIRIRLRNTPLQRDEGEYAYAGQLMLQGIPPYKLAYNMKLPGTYLAYAAMMAAFGETVAGIRIAVLFVLVANTLLLFFLTRRLFGLLAATAAAAFYTLLANRWSTLSLDGHATHFIMLAALAGTLLLLQAVDSQSRIILMLSGICFGMAFLMKQQGVTYAVFAGLYWIGSEWKRSASLRRLVSGCCVLASGIAIPYLITCLWLWWAGVFRQFWFWTVHYGAAYEKIVSWSEGWKQFNLNWPSVPRPALIWWMAGFGLTALFWNRRAREHNVLVLSFAFFSILAVVPGLYFRQHYFLVLLPGVAMLAGLAIGAPYEMLQGRNRLSMLRWIPVAFFLLAYISGLVGQKKYFVRMTPLQISRQMYHEDGFAEAQVVGDYVRDHTSDKDRIAVIASEPEIYFYSHRHSATGYMYMYPLTEKQKFAHTMQEEMIHEVQESEPEMIVFNDTMFTWGCSSKWPDVSPDPSMDMFLWMHHYLDAHYEQVAEVPIHSQAGSSCSHFVFRRR
jgi:hypothetical protein